MSLHLFAHNGTLRILIAYESGKVALREFVKSDRTTSVEGLGWKVLWKVKLGKVKLHARHQPGGVLLPAGKPGCTRQAMSVSIRGRLYGPQAVVGHLCTVLPLLGILLWRLRWASGVS
ncbi:hypothetical protein EV421DRAFT_99843 [Armillaria borealis]|uniref:Uncharacterized protein n=1 Tax=Armillaria borealis TaxID=47425 RepID=A0AA39N3K4_9AGAR|nr:hypothetical protein EV421DRAFT_99843 [Armillaria borealis]